MFSRVKAWANSQSRLAVLRRNFNNWKNSHNARAYSSYVYMGKANFGKPHINNFNRELAEAIRNQAHNKAGSLERKYANLRKTASRYANKSSNYSQNAFYSGALK